MSDHGASKVSCPRKQGDDCVYTMTRNQMWVHARLNSMSINDYILYRHTGLINIEQWLILPIFGSRILNNSHHEKCGKCLAHLRPGHGSQGVYQT